MHTETPGVHVDIEKTVRDSENVAVCKPRREASEDTSLPTPWSWTSSSFPNWENRVLLFKSPKVWSLVTAALANQCNPYNNQWARKYQQPHCHSLAHLMQIFQLPTLPRTGLRAKGAVVNETQSLTLESLRTGGPVWGGDRQVSKSSQHIGGVCVTRWGMCIP